MFKKLDILIIRSFIGPFIVTFFVALFVLVMQFFWLYMDELIGKGLSTWLILQLLMYMSTTLVPLALPLSVLLASIMTFGNLGENFELVALKSSGISMLRFMRPLGIFVFIISVAAFVFSNNVIPVANLKALSLLYDVRNAKPTLNIKPDQFNNDIKDFSIRVGSKDKDGFTIHDILIYDHTDLVGNNKVIIAKEGQMIPTPDKQGLIFRLKDGWRYEEGYEHGTHAAEFPQTRMHFAKWDKAFDLSKFSRSNEDLFKNAYQMMDVQQLGDAIDSFKRTKKTSVATLNSYLQPYLTLTTPTKEAEKLGNRLASNPPHVTALTGSFLESLPADRRITILQSTSNNLHNLKAMLNNNGFFDGLQKENSIKFGIEYHRKFSLSFACMLLFLIGAPMGAIIRKGGLGMPLVFAVVCFIAFFIINIVGEKLAKSSSLPTWGGMWLSTAILMPLAIWLIRAAKNDANVLTKELYIRIYRSLMNNRWTKRNSIV